MNKLFKSIGLTMVATLFARFLGFLREVLIAYKFGTTALSDSFIVSFSIPELIISGFGTAIGILYIPLFFKIKSRENEEDIAKYNFGVSLLLIVIAAFIIAIFYTIPNIFIKIFASGFDNETLDLTIRLTKIIIWSNFPIMLAYLYKAFAQMKNKFAIATFMGCTVNLTVIVALLFVSEDIMMILAYATLLGNSIYAVMLYIFVKRNGYKQKATINIFNDDIKEMGKGILPICFSNLIFEINQIIDRNFASNLAVGTISALNYSSKIINLITAIFGTSIASIVYPRITKMHSEGNEKQEAEELMNINQFMLFFLIPGLILLCVWAMPVISILFEHGNFNLNSVKITTECLIFYSIGVIGFNLKAIWVRVFNARFDTKIPAFNSLIAVIVNVIMNFSLIGILQHRGLALSTGVASVLTDILLIYQYSKANCFFNVKELLVETLKISGSCIAFIPLLVTSNLFFREISFVNIICLMLGCAISFALYMISLCIVKNKVAIKIIPAIRIKVNRE